MSCEAQNSEICVGAIVDLQQVIRSGPPSRAPGTPLSPNGGSKHTALSPVKESHCEEDERFEE